MKLSEIQKIILIFITVIAWSIGIFISISAAKKGRQMKEDMGVSFKTYILLIGITEILYTVGAVMILSAMSFSVLQYLARLEFWKFYGIISKFDIATTKIIGVIGWIGFAINRSISFLCPGYLLLSGGRKLPKYFYYSAWMEIGLETLLTLLIFVSLITG